MNPEIMRSPIFSSPVALIVAGLLALSPAFFVILRTIIQRRPKPENGPPAELLDVPRYPGDVEEAPPDLSKFVPAPPGAPPNRPAIPPGPRVVPSPLSSLSLTVTEETPTIPLARELLRRWGNAPEDSPAGRARVAVKAWLED